MNTYFYSLLLMFSSLLSLAQEPADLIENPEAYADPSSATQFAFVQELLYIAGYVPEQIDIYQTLPNYAHVYRVKLDSVNGGFIFVRWNKKEQRHVVANKMIDPGMYYNLNAAQEILRMQTDKATFSTEDISLQASDQFKLSGQDINGLRKAYEEKLEAKKMSQANMHQEQLNRAQRKVERKKSKSKN
jgi:hypothetical protein